MIQNPHSSSQNGGVAGGDQAVHAMWQHTCMVTMFQAHGWVHTDANVGWYVALMIDYSYDED